MEQADPGSVFKIRREVTGDRDDTAADDDNISFKPGGNASASPLGSLLDRRADRTPRGPGN
jgi:hypothetical protein